MSVRRPLLLFACLLTSVTLLSQGSDAAKELRAIAEKYGQVEVTFKYPGFDALGDIAKKVPVAGVKDGIVECVLAERDIDRFIELGLNYKITPYEGRKAVESALSVEEAMKWDLYPTYPQYDTIMHKFAEDYPQLCLVDTIGQSVEGRQILSLKISDNVETDEAEPEVFYTSTMHGDEMGGFVLLLQLADHLLKNYGTGDIETALIDSLEIYINPLANPDGTYNNGDTISSPTRANDNGTDLNRNYPDPLNPSIVPDVENVAMIDFMRGRHFSLSANIHAGYEVLNFPWDRWSSKIPADSVWFYTICRRYADTVHNYSTAAYLNYYNEGVVRGSVWYVIKGGRQDFVTYELQGREVTFELDDTKQTPAAQLPLLWQNNYRSLLRYIENAYYGIHGFVLDDATGLPIKAEIYIQDHDVDSSQVLSDPGNGFFTRYLEPGTWSLTVTAEDYDTQVISGIEVVDWEQTRIEIRLTTSTTLNEQLADNKLKIWPQPASGELYLSNFNISGGYYTASIYNHSGSIVKRLKNLQAQGNLLKIDISELGAGYYIMNVESEHGDIFRGKIIKI